MNKSFMYFKLQRCLGGTLNHPAECTTQEVTPSNLISHHPTASIHPSKGRCMNQHCATARRTSSCPEVTFP